MRKNSTRGDMEIYLLLVVLFFAVLFVLTTTLNNGTITSSLFQHTELKKIELDVIPTDTPTPTPTI